MAFSFVEEIIFNRLSLCKSSMGKLNGSHWKFRNKTKESHCILNQNQPHIFSQMCFWNVLPKHKYLKHNIFCTHEIIRNYNTVDSASNQVSNSVSVKYIKELLTSHNIEFEDGFTCLITKCPVCNTPQEDGMFINKTTGKFSCK